MNEGEHRREKEMIIEIGSPKSEDAKEIAQLFLDTWLATYPNTEFGITEDDIRKRFAPRFMEEDLARAASRIENPAESEKTIIAKIEGKIAGICRLTLFSDHNELQMLCVRPEFQNKGVGTVLWEKVGSFATEGKDTFVNVAIYNANAIRFYERLGFKDTGERLSDERFRMPSGGLIPEMRMKLETV